MKVKHDMSRKTNAQSIVFPIVLKSIIAHTHRDTKTFALNDKQIRAKLRVALATSHVRNTSWIAANMREYDAIRCAYDNAYATSRANARKRNAKTNVVATNVDDNVNVDA